MQGQKNDVVLEVFVYDGEVGEAGDNCKIADVGDGRFVIGTGEKQILLTIIYAKKRVEYFFVFTYYKVGNRVLTI